MLGIGVLGCLSTIVVERSVIITGTVTGTMKLDGTDYVEFQLAEDQWSTAIARADLLHAELQHGQTANLVLSVNRGWLSGTILGYSIELPGRPGPTDAWLNGNRVDSVFARARPIRQ